MLQQILRDMWVDPEILAELDDTQKQTLFCKMREEQVRRWRIWDQKISTQETPAPPCNKTSSIKKTVQFLAGEDGEPWVWVMGEHKDDKYLEALLQEETHDKPERITQLIDYPSLDTIDEKLDISPKTAECLEEALEMYCSVDELRARIAALRPEVLDQRDQCDQLDQHDQRDQRATTRDMHNNNKNMMHFNFVEGKKDSLPTLAAKNESSTGGGALGAGAGAVSGRVAAWERRVAAARASDLLRTLRRARRHAQEQVSIEQDATWREQERKAKEAEAAMREIARAARAEHRRSIADQPAGADAPESALPSSYYSQGKPPNREAVVEWFKRVELPRGSGMDKHKQPASWFHGVISRLEAERALAGGAAGTFLVRVSERVWGYALSVLAAGRCKHFLLEASAPPSPPAYRFLGGAHHRTHDSLEELVAWHGAHSITEGGGELLLQPRAPSTPPAILQCSAPSP